MQITVFRNLLLALSFAIFSPCLRAAPITITQTFSNVDHNDYGISTGVSYGQVQTGDWIFRGTVDSNALNVSPWTDSGVFQLTSLTLTQASLGLFDVAITNVPMLFFFPDRFGFSFNQYGGAPWTVIVYEANHFSNANTLEEYLALVVTPTINHPFTGFGPQWDGFELQDGRRLYGSAGGVGTASVGSAVSEPTASGLVLVALTMLVVSLQIRRKRG